MSLLQLLVPPKGQIVESWSLPEQTYLGKFEAPKSFPSANAHFQRDEDKQRGSPFQAPVVTALFVIHGQGQNVCKFFTPGNT